MKLWNFEKHAERTAVVTEDGTEFRYAELDLLRQKLALPSGLQRNFSSCMDRPRRLPESAICQPKIV